MDTSLPLAGQGRYFTACDVLIRDKGQVNQCLLGLDPLRRWAGEEGVGDQVERVLSTLSAPRPAFAGLDMGKVHLMGVVNVTPDSFSDGGAFLKTEAAVAQALRLVEEGASIIDVGGESTRPGAAPVSPEEESARVIPVIRALAERGVLVSVDTRHAIVMEQACAAGAGIINDVSALTHDPAALPVVIKLKKPVILMHMQGDPHSMQQAPCYGFAPLDVYDYLAGRVAECLRAGIKRENIALDVGIGFGKADVHNLQLLDHLALFHGLGCPLVLGVSRKSFIGRLSRGEPPQDRLPGSLAGALAGVERGVQMLRVHDVAQTRQALVIVNAL